MQSVAVTHWKGEVVVGFLTELCSESTDAPRCDLLEDEIPCHNLLDLFQAMLPSLPNVLTTAHKYHDFVDSSVFPPTRRSRTYLRKMDGLGMFGDFLLVSAGLQMM
jgi:hypothetical protein